VVYRIELHIVKMRCVVRRKRDTFGESRENDLLEGSYVSQEDITSQDSAEPPPDGPIHESSVFPTRSGINETTAEDLCIAAIRTTDVFQECLHYTANNTEHYIQSCVDDIKVTSIVCKHLQGCPKR